MNLLFEYTDPHVRAIRGVLSVYGDDLTSDEDGYDEIQTSLNDCEWGFLGEFQIKIFISHSSFFLHISKILIFVQSILVY